MHALRAARLRAAGGAYAPSLSAHSCMTHPSPPQILLDELARGATPPSFTIPSMALPPILHYGSQYLKEKASEHDTAPRALGTGAALR
jgi:hypothetical protein